MIKRDDKSGILLDYFWDDYFTENDLRENTAETYRSSVALFERWYTENHSHAIEWHHVDHKTINRFLIYYSKTESENHEGTKSSHTVRSRKSTLMAVLNNARRKGLCSFDTERIRKIRTTSTPKDYWGIDEVAQLADASKRLSGRFRSTMILKRHYARAYVLTVWDTALRRGDMALLKVGTIDPELQFTHPRAKTGVTDICRVNKATYAAIQITFDQYNTSRKLYFPPWQGGKDPLRSISRLFRTLELMAGLQSSDSCLKKLVRSSIMEADQRAPGTGWLQGHHSDPNTTFQSYANRQRANLNRPKNREIS